MNISDNKMDNFLQKAMAKKKQRQSSPKAYGIYLSLTRKKKKKKKH